MTRPALTPAERDLIVTLCQVAFDHKRGPHVSTSAVYDLMTVEDWQRCRSIIGKLTDDEPREPELGGASDEPESYTPPGGRL